MKETGKLPIKNDFYVIGWIVENSFGTASYKEYTVRVIYQKFNENFDIQKFDYIQSTNFTNNHEYTFWDSDSKYFVTRSLVHCTT